MKKIIAIFGTLCVVTSFTFAQGASEIGTGGGVTFFFGSLGKKTGFGNKTYFGDLAGSEIRPSGTFYYQYTFPQRVTVKVSLTAGQITGDDKTANSNAFRDEGWYRSYRNLSFKSRIVELGVSGQFNILRYMPGDLHDRWTPYVTAGVGVFNFDPQAYYNGQWYRLQPLGTEGQGMPQYPDRQKYSLIQPDLMLGFGFKFNATRNLAIGFEFGHRVCFTGYLDDVNSTYVSEKEFVSFYGQQKGELAYALSRRSVEIDPEGHYASITDKGQPRGNANKNDAYAFSQVSIAYTLGSQKYSGNRFHHRSHGHHRTIKRYRSSFR